MGARKVSESTAPFRWSGTGVGVAYVHSGAKDGVAGNAEYRRDRLGGDVRSKQGVGRFLEIHLVVKWLTVGSRLTTLESNE